VLERPIRSIASQLRKLSRIRHRDPGVRPSTETNRRSPLASACLVRTFCAPASGGPYELRWGDAMKKVRRAMALRPSELDIQDSGKSLSRRRRPALVDVAEAVLAVAPVASCLADWRLSGVADAEVPGRVVDLDLSPLVAERADPDSFLPSAWSRLKKTKMIS